MSTLTVVMPVYNGDTFLHEAIKSITEQTYEDFEFIIINDGSTDKSMDIIENFSKTDSRIKVINQENRGLPESLNRAIKEAKGKLIARMDADDVSLPKRFEKQMTAIEKYRYDLVGTGIQTMDQHGSIKGKHLYPQQHRDISAMLPMRNCICHPSVMFSRDCFLEAGGYDVGYRNCQDYDLWLRMLKNGQMHNIREPLLRHRRHGNRISAKSNISRQTNYSVCAALNFFNRRADFESLIPIAAPDQVCESIERLLNWSKDKYSRDCIIRHATRYSRNCLEAGEARSNLMCTVLDGANLYQRLKWLIYEKAG